MPVPRDLKALSEPRRLRVDWGSGGIVDLPYVFLRGACECAGCVDERTGVRTLDLNAIPADIAITSMALVGNYALRIVWSDGHATGLYTWDRLAEMRVPEQNA